MSEETTMEWVENARKFQEIIENAFNHEVALQRIRDCDDRILILSGLGLSEIPPLPEGITILRCEMNQLTSLPTLPSSLTFLSCQENLLTSLPTLPSSLRYLSCSDNLLSSLPSLPSSLISLSCMQNTLTSLPPLPPSLMRLCIDEKNIIHLPEFPPLEILSCSYIQMIYLPPLPSLRSLLLFSNPLEILHESPLTLIRAVYVLPHNNEPFEVEDVTPEQIQQINREDKEWMEVQSMGRCMERCSAFYEELMHNRWNPDRVFQLREMGYQPDEI